MMSLAGVRFVDAWSRRVNINFDGVIGYVISRRDLIANKRAVGRPQDLVDLNNLIESERLGDKPLPKAAPRKKRRKGRKPERGNER